jgi:excisionase family DNA binding protein
VTSYQFGGNPSLLCQTCGKLATHAHFIPWIEEPERVELACEVHEPGGDDGEWYTLLELAAEPVGFAKIAARSVTPPPTALMAWLDEQQPQKGPPIEDAHAPAATDDDSAWSTVAQVAERHRLSAKTVRAAVARGDLEAHRSGGRAPFRIHRDAEAAWVSARKVPTPRRAHPRRARKGQPQRRFRDMVSE